jgi:tetratricopeptide (TPR) repeat protein
MRCGTALLALALLVAPRVTALGGEPDPWAGEPRHLRHRMEELADAEARGELGHEEREQLRTYWSTHLHRGPMDALESAHYSIAELHLERADPKAALAELNQVLAAAQSDAVRHLTHLNLGQVYRLRLNDAAKAVEHFDQVGGPLHHRAQQYMLALLEERGKPDEAAKLLEKQIADAKEKGRKLALLHRLASLYKRSKMTDKALATYRRITAEFTAADLKQMRDALAREVEGTFQRLRDLQVDGRGHEAEQLAHGLHRKADELRFAGRWDEARAFQQAMHKGFRALQEFHQRREREERERRGEPERRREGEF